MESSAKQPPHIPEDELKFPDHEEGTERPKAIRWVLIGIVALLIIILAGLLMWLYQIRQTATDTVSPTPTRPTAEQNNEPESDTAEAAVVSQQAMSPSTELSSIETDLNGTQMTDLEPLFADVEAVLE